MIGKLSYEELENMIKEFRAQIEIILKLMKGRGVPDLKDFCDSVEIYCKFLENTIELNKDADIALKGIAM